MAAMRRRFRVVYLVLVPALAVAAGILGYFTWQTAAQFARLGEESIVQSTVLLVQEKVDRVEQNIIDADNAVFHLIDLESPAAIEEAWAPLAERISPSVRAVLVLDDGGEPVGYAARATETQKRDFLKLFLERILPDLELQRQREGRLKHLHQSYDGRSYLISYKAIRHQGRRYYVIAHHDTGYLVREVLPDLFATEEGKRFYNIIDENNRRVLGPSLREAGDYLVARRFPTTLYQWRLQVAPKQAPLLDAQARSRRFTELGLLATSFVIILLGVAFLIYAADKERRLNALKSDFIANVSHELKTPLSVVRMFAEMLLTNRVKSDEKRREYLEIMVRESERLTSLIENVLDFAALERGKQRYRMADDGDLVRAIGRAVETFRYRMEKEGIEVRFTKPSNLSPMRLDEQAIVLAVVNLLDNAVKYGGTGAIDVMLETVGAEARVRVRDRGPGIAAKDLERVFERFYRAPRGPNAAHVRGSGIGLALVKHIAEAHGGRAWAENALDGGAIVAFAIPIKTGQKRDREEGAPSVERPLAAE